MRILGVTANQFLKTGVMAVLFIILFKYAAARSNMPGLQAAARLA